EGAVEGGGVFGGVGEYGDVGVTFLVERVTDGGHLPVHHPGQSEQLGSCLGLGEGDGGVAGQGGVVVDPPGRVEHAAVAVVGELVQAQVGLHHELVAHVVVQCGGGAVEDPLGIVGGAAGGVPVVRDTEEHDPADPGVSSLLGGPAQGVHAVLLHAGHGLDGAGLGRFGDEHGQHQ